MNSINENEKNYISIPWASWLRFVLFLGSIALPVGCFYLIKILWIADNLGSLGKENITSISQIKIIPWFIIEYCLIGLVFICFTAWIKKGFTNLKSFKNDGLIYWLIYWLIAGLIIGIIAWLIYGLIYGLIVWLIVWLILGLIAGLIVGLIAGLIDEFK